MLNDVPPPEDQADGADESEPDENLEVFEEISTDVPNPTSATEASIEDDVTLPDEITGQAAATDEDLTTLFRNASQSHYADGFHGASGDDAAGIPRDDGDAPDVNAPELE
jgi:hypothetical protein